MNFKSFSTLIFLTLIIFSITLPNTLNAQWAGSSSINNNIYRNGNVCIGGSTPEQLLTLSHPTEPVLRFERTNPGHYDFEMFATSGGHLKFRGGSSGTGSSLNNLMTIRRDAKVLINTNNAPSALSGIDLSAVKLYVQGGILTEKVLVKEGWADYVFYDDYQLKSLRDVEAHIKKHGHLHNTPSAKAIEDGGLDLGALTVNQQEKIEELYLHLIEKEKEINELKSVINNMQKQLNKLDNASTQK